MSRNTKIILAVVAGVLVLLCLCSCTLLFVTSRFVINNSRTVSSESVRAAIEEGVQVEPAQLGESDPQATPFQLPDGWRSDYAMNIAGFRLVGYRPDGGTGHIMLAVAPETTHTNIEELEREVRGLASSHGYRWNQKEMVVVERKPITINGEATEMVVAEGNGSGGPWRQAMVVYRGERGLTLVIYGMPTDAYNQAEADALFASIR